MRALRPTIERKYFIDKKIREKKYPTAASIAKDYEIEFNKRIDPRTIASDIAQLKEIYSAPIKYDPKKKGYYYTDSDFRLNVFEEGSEDILIENSLAKDIRIPDWQKQLLFPLIAEVLPLKKNISKRDFSNTNITVLPSESSASESSNIESNFMNALKSNVVLHVEISNSTKVAERYDFLPLHLVCRGKERLYFGKKIIKEVKGQESFYLLNIATVATVAVSYSPPKRKVHEKEIADPITSSETEVVYSINEYERKKAEKNPFSYYAQTTGNHDIEVIMVNEKEKNIFVFTSYLSIKNKEKIQTYKKVGEFYLSSLE